MSRRTSLRRGGFTLVELLIVAGVIAILTAVTVPAVNRARAASRVVSCTNNLRQINTAVVAWGQKYNNMRLPGAAWPTAVEKVTSADAAARILVCPDAPPFYSVSTTNVPPGTDLPSALVDFEKNNKPHKVTWVQNGPDQWTATEVYHKNWPDYATFVFTRTSGNNWTGTPTYISPNKRGGVGPPLMLQSVFNNVTHNNVQVGTGYAITGPPVSPVTNTSNFDASSYGINLLVTNALAPKNDRVLVMCYNKNSVDVDTDVMGTFLVGRHYNKKHNVLKTDGSVQLQSIKELDFTKNRATVYANQ